MARDICRSSKLLKKRERERERERKKRRRIPGIGIFTPFLRVCHTLSELSLDHHITCTRVLTLSYQISKTLRRYRIRKMRTSTILFSEAFLSFLFSFFFFFFSLFETPNYGISVQRKRNFLNLMLVIPCLFRCLSPDRMSISVIQSPETARDIFPCVSFILSHFIFSLFLYSSKEIRAHPDIPSLVCSSPFMDQDIVIGLSFEGVHWWFRPLYRWENDRGFKKVAIAGIFNGN